MFFQYLIKFLFFFCRLISIIELYSQLHYKYLQSLQDIWYLQALNTTLKVKLNYRDRKLEEDLKNFITRTWALFVQIKSKSCKF